MSVPVDIIQNSEGDFDETANNSVLVCRGCLKSSGEMKNIYEWDLDEDFFSCTDIPRHALDWMPELLCESCEANLQIAKNFKEKCHQSDVILRSRVKKTNGGPNTVSKVQVTSVLRNKVLLLLITAPNPEDKILLQCPYKLCGTEFYKKTLLINHLRKVHDISTDFEIEQQFYCTVENCTYNLTSNPTKFFTGRKYLNQHYSNMHKEKNYSCDACNKKFAKSTDYNRHLKTCNLVFTCTLCNVNYTSNESYVVHLMRRHPELHAKYKEDKKAQKRFAEAKEKDSKAADIDQPMKIRKEMFSNETNNKITNISKEGNYVKLLQFRSTNKMTKCPPLQSNMDVFESTIPPVENIGDIYLETPYIVQQHTIRDDVHREFVTEDTSAPFAGSLTVAENYTIKTETVESIPVIKIEDSQEPLSEEHINTAESANNDIDGFKKSSATQIPEDITNDVSFTAWTNKNDFELQNEMSTQTVFEDLLSMKSQHSEDEVFFSESVPLSDIQTQTAPFEFGLSRCNKETQSCTSQTQSPDLSIKETQTCFCHYDSPRHNFRHFESLSSSPGSANFISAETQTADFRTAVRSDVLLSFSSAETQTHFDESSKNAM